MQYEQYEQEVRDLQGLIEEAHRVIQDRPIPTSSIQELQAQILHHEVQYVNSISLPLFHVQVQEQLQPIMLWGGKKYRERIPEHSVDLNSN